MSAEYDPFSPWPPARNPFVRGQRSAVLVRDPLTGEYAVRSTHNGTAGEVIRGCAHSWEWRWDRKARCWYVEFWAVDRLVEALSQRGFVVRIADRPPVDLDQAHHSQ